jgi:hypothetical protein
MVFLACATVPAAERELASGAFEDQGLTLSWEKETLTIHGRHLPGGMVKVWYLEAFSRPGSTNRDWKQSVIPHKNQLREISSDSRILKLRSTLADGVIVNHTIQAARDEVDFRLVATNPTQVVSQAHWGLPCIGVDAFTGVKLRRGSEEYLPKCFLFLDGKLTRLPTGPWATQALETPGQVWCPAHVNRNDVNPHPLSSLVPSNGLIGCFSADESMILATAWEPYQDLFQGVIVCLHADFRVGGLKPGQSKPIRGKIYLVPGDVATLVRRYERDFPEHLSPPR